MMSIQKETSKDGRRPTKRRLRRPSANTNIWRLVFKVKASSAFVTTSSTKRQESAFVEPTIYQLPTVSVEEQHDSLTAQWAKFSETSDRVH
jgi:phage gp16-like protein